MTVRPYPLVLLAITAALAAPSALYNDFPVIVPQKRAALVLDRLLVALQKALHEDAASGREAPRAVPMRVGGFDDSGLAGSLEGGAPGLRLGPHFTPEVQLGAFQDEMSALQRRGQGGAGRGRVLRCYFNAVTCF